MDTTDVQRLEARLTDLESKIGQLVQMLGAAGRGSSMPSGGMPSGGMPIGGSAQEASSTPSPGAWLAGALARSISPQGVPGVLPGGVQPMIQADSIFWCTSRFICATMNCGGTGWC